MRVLVVAPLLQINLPVFVKKEHVNRAVEQFTFVNIRPTNALEKEVMFIHHIEKLIVGRPQVFGRMFIELIREADPLANRQFFSTSTGFKVQFLRYFLPLFAGHGEIVVELFAPLSEAFFDDFSEGLGGMLWPGVFIALLEFDDRRIDFGARIKQGRANGFQQQRIPSALYNRTEHTVLFCPWLGTNSLGDFFLNHHHSHIDRRWRIHEILQNRRRGRIRQIPNELHFSFFEKRTNIEFSGIGVDDL